MRTPAPVNASPQPMAANLPVTAASVASGGLWRLAAGGRCWLGSAVSSGWCPFVVGAPATPVRPWVPLGDGGLAASQPPLEQTARTHQHTTHLLVQGRQNINVGDRTMRRAQPSLVRRQSAEPAEM